jgi:hypothetical protein
MKSSRKIFYCYFRPNEILDPTKDRAFVEQLSDHQRISKSYTEVDKTYQLSLPEKQKL